jgi:uncharacterized protein YeaO (DUF488 family)
MPLHTKRWNDPREPGDGFRLLICRYRPRGVKKSEEPWDEWWPELAPSRELLAAYYGKAGQAIDFSTYGPRYLTEMAGQTFRIRALAQRVNEGENVTLLCSSACIDPERCHRTLLARVIARTTTSR